MRTWTGKMLAAFGFAVVASAAFPAAGSCGETPGGTVVEHTVIKGDNLMLLAGYYYKDPRQWREIYVDNSGLLGDPNLIIPGTVLKVRDRSGGRWSISYEEFARQARN